MALDSPPPPLSPLLFPPFLLCFSHQHFFSLLLFFLQEDIFDDLDFVWSKVKYYKFINLVSRKRAAGHPPTKEKARKENVERKGLFLWWRMPKTGKGGKGWRQKSGQIRAGVTISLTRENWLPCATFTLLSWSLRAHCRFNEATAIQWKLFKFTFTFQQYYTSLYSLSKELSLSRIILDFIRF